MMRTSATATPSVVPSIGAMLISRWGRGLPAMHARGRVDDDGWHGADGHRCAGKRLSNPDLVGVSQDDDVLPGLNAPALHGLKRPAHHLDEAGGSRYVMGIGNLPFHGGVSFSVS